MSIEIPQAARYWPPRACVVHLMRIGTKCRVAWLPDEEGQWLEAGGVIPSEVGDTDPSDDTPAGGVGLDAAQARVYFRCEGKEQIPVCRVLLPDNFHFRSSLKGKVNERSKSFDADGNPVPQVRLLYALKTESHDDRLRAVEAFPLDIWDADTFGKIFCAMDEAAKTLPNFHDFAGWQLASSAARTSGLSDWVLWEKVADAAAENKREKRPRTKTTAAPSTE